MVAVTLISFLARSDCLNKAYRAGLYTDLKITCGSTEFNVHKIILCSQSKVFRTMCSSGFIVCTIFRRPHNIIDARKLIALQEASTNTIDLTKDPVNLVTRLIECFYLGTYDDFKPEDDVQFWKSAHQLHAEMFSLGDKYDCAVLKEPALVKFKEHTDKNDVQDLLGFIASIPIVYSSTLDSERALRDVVVDKVKGAPRRFLAEDVKVPFRKAVCEVPDFSWDLHLHWMSGP